MVSARAPAGADSGEAHVTIGAGCRRACPTPPPPECRKSGIIISALRPRPASPPPSMVMGLTTMPLRRRFTCADRGRLFLDGEVAVEDPDAAELRHHDRHVGSVTVSTHRRRQDECRARSRASPRVRCWSGSAPCRSLRGWRRTSSKVRPRRMSMGASFLRGAGRGGPCKQGPLMRWGMIGRVAFATAQPIC